MQSFQPQPTSELFRAVLASVSRSFYLTLRVLPEGLRQPIGLAYLLARTSDTIADSLQSRVEERVQALRLFLEALEGGALEPLQQSLQVLEQGIARPEEKRLIQRVPAMVHLLQQTEERDRADILWVLKIIVEGQALDIRRFGREGEVVSLKDPAELDEYTYSVAGCVGAFWTRLCFRHLPRYARLPQDRMESLGITFGKGLQLVNILRDFQEDLRNGRCYLPDAGIGESTKSLPGKALDKTYAFWTEKAMEWLDAGRVYAAAIRPWRLRLALYLPWALGVRTIELLRETPAHRVEHRIKVSRFEVKKSVIKGVFWAFFGK